MKAKASWILIPILGVALVAGAAWSFAQAPDPEDDPLPDMELESAQGAMPMMGPDLREQLGLTDEQAEKLRALWVEGWKSGCGPTLPTGRPLTPSCGSSPTRRARCSASTSSTDWRCTAS